MRYDVEECASVGMQTFLSCGKSSLVFALLAFLSHVRPGRLSSGRIRNTPLPALHCIRFAKLESIIAKATSSIGYLVTRLAIGLIRSLGSSSPSSSVSTVRTCSTSQESKLYLATPLLSHTLFRLFNIALPSFPAILRLSNKIFQSDIPKH